MNKQSFYFLFLIGVLSCTSNTPNTTVSVKEETDIQILERAAAEVEKLITLPCKTVYLNED